MGLMLILQNEVKHFNRTSSTLSSYRKEGEAAEQTFAAGISLKGKANMLVD